MCGTLTAIYAVAQMGLRGKGRRGASASLLPGLWIAFLVLVLGRRARGGVVGEIYARSRVAAKHVLKGPLSVLYAGCMHSWVSSVSRVKWRLVDVSTVEWRSCLCLGVTTRIV